MDNFAVKTIKSVDYVKGIDITNYLGKKNHNSGRFIRETFSDSDVLKSNATLFVRKSAVEKKLFTNNQISEMKVKELEMKVKKLETEIHKANKFMGYLYKELRKIEHSPS